MGSVWVIPIEDFKKFIIRSVNLYNILIENVFKTTKTNVIYCITTGEI